MSHNLKRSPEDDSPDLTSAKKKFSVPREKHADSSVKTEPKSDSVGDFVPSDEETASSTNLDPTSEGSPGILNTSTNTEHRSVSVNNVTFGGATVIEILDHSQGRSALENLPEEENLPSLDRDSNNYIKNDSDSSDETLTPGSPSEVGPFDYPGSNELERIRSDTSEETLTVEKTMITCQNISSESEISVNSDKSAKSENIEIEVIKNRKPKLSIVSNSSQATFWSFDDEDEEKTEKHSEPEKIQEDYEIAEKEERNDKEKRKKRNKKDAAEKTLPPSTSEGQPVRIGRFLIYTVTVAPPIVPPRPKHLNQQRGKIALEKLKAAQVIDEGPVALPSPMSLHVDVVSDTDESGDSRRGSAASARSPHDCSGSKEHGGSWFNRPSFSKPPPSALRQNPPFRSALSEGELIARLRRNGLRESGDAGIFCSDCRAAQNPSSCKPNVCDADAVDSFRWYRLNLNRNRLQAASSTSELFAAFAMIALVEMQINTPCTVPDVAWALFSVNTALLVGLNVLALTISTHVLPALEASARLHPRHPRLQLREAPHETLRAFGHIAWATSSVLGLALFFVEVALISWVKFWDLAVEGAIASTAIVGVSLIAFVAVVIYFWRYLEPRWRTEPTSSSQAGEGGKPQLWRRIHVALAKLEAAASTSELIAGFATMAIVELQTNTPTLVPPWLFIFLAVNTTFLVLAHVFALMVATFVSPSMQAAEEQSHYINGHQVAPGEHIHERMRAFIELAWTLSTVIGMLLFLVEVAILCWIKFWDFSLTGAAASCAVIVVAMLLFTGFGAHFWHVLVLHRTETVRSEKLEGLARQLSAVRHIETEATRGGGTVSSEGDRQVTDLPRVRRNEVNRPYI